MCCDSPSPPPAPDFSSIAAASDKAAEYGYQAAGEDLAFRRQVYEESRPRQQQLYDLATRVADQQMGIAGANEQRAGQQWQQYQQAYMPLEQQMVADAYGAGNLNEADRMQLNELITGGGGNLTAAARLAALQTLAQRAEEGAATAASARAGGQVNQAFGMQARNLARYGAGDPGRMATMATKLGGQQTLAQVGAANQAREGVRNQGISLRAGAASFGRNMPNAAGQAYGLATNAGSAATANQNQGFMSGLPYAQLQAGGYGNQLGAAGLAQQGALGMGGLMNQSYGNQLSAYNAQLGAQGAMWSGLGQLGGLLGYGYMTGPK